MADKKRAIKTQRGDEITWVYVDQGDGTYAERVALVANAGVEIGDVGVASVTLPTTVYNGQNTVASAGTAEALATSQALVSGVHVKALNANVGIVYVGDSSVDSATGYELSAGESVFLETDNLADVYIDAATSADGVCYIGS